MSNIVGGGLEGGGGGGADQVSDEFARDCLLGAFEKAPQM